MLETTRTTGSTRLPPPHPRTPDSGASLKLQGRHASDTAISPPDWGSRPIYACPECGRRSPVHRYELSTLQHLKWQVATAVYIVSWCGHGHEHVIVPEFNGWAQLIPVLGEAT